jgi:sec-independent protein translocase protein TatB
MFDIGWGELIVIGIVALIAIGPKELPGALRTLGQWVGKVRRMASDFQGQFQEAIREAELDELKKEVDQMAAQAGNYSNFDPVEEARKEVEKAVGDVPPLDAPASTAASAGTVAPPVTATVAAEPLPAPQEQKALAPVAAAKPDAGKAPA